MNHDELKDWARRAAQTLNDFCLEAQEATGRPDDRDQLLDMRTLIFEYERHSRGVTELASKNVEQTL